MKVRLVNKILYSLFFICLYAISFLTAQIDSLNCPHSINFDGKDDFIQIKSPSIGKKSFTLEQWFLSNDNNAQFCDTGSLSNFRWLFSLGNEQLGMGICGSKLKLVSVPFGSDPQNLVKGFPEITIETSRWNHIGIAWDTAVGGKIYFNGDPIFNLAPTNLLIPEFLYLAESERRIGQSWHGEIDEFRVWNYKRNDEEILREFNCNLSGSEKGLILYYPFQQGIAMGDNSQTKFIRDFTTYKNNGEIKNMLLNGLNSNFLCSNLVLDSSCISGKNCLCVEPDSILFFNDDFTFAALCNQRGFLTLPCNLSDSLFVIKGKIICDETCQRRISYTIVDNQTNQFVKAGNALLVKDFFQISEVPIKALEQNKLYVLRISTYCGTDSCLCIIPFKIDCSHFCSNLALQFDGNKDHVICKSPILPSAPYSIEFIFKTDSLYLDRCNVNNGMDMKWLFSFKDNKFGLAVCDNKLKLIDNNKNTIFPYNDSNFPDYSIYKSDRNHIILCWDTATGGQIYLNGQYFYDFGKAEMNLKDSFVIGSRFRIDLQDTFQFSNSWNGTIDEFKIWNYKRSKLEIFNTIGCKTLNDEKGLIAYYDFNQGSGGINNTIIKSAIDKSSRKNHGKLMNFSLMGSKSNFICDSLVLLDTCVYRDCTVDFTFQLNDCNRISLFSLPNLVPSNEDNRYQWSSDIGGLNTTSKNPVFQFLLEDTIVEICLEVSNDLCNRKICKSIKLNQSRSIHFTNCPNDLFFYDCKAFFRDSVQAFDSCSSKYLNVIYTRSDGKNIRDAFDLGITNVIATVKSIFQKEYRCEWRIHVIDTVPPECLPLSPTVTLDDRGQVKFSSSILKNQIVDGCSEVKIEPMEYSFDCMDLGSKLLNFIVSDESNNTRQCSYTIRIEDRMSPSCFGKDTTLIAENENGIRYNFNLDTKDNCSFTKTNCSFPSGSIFPCGITNVSCTAEDGSGNLARCHFIVDVRDCKSCCKNQAAFQNLLNQGLKVEAMLNNRGECIARLYPPKLLTCQHISRIQWGDGTIMNGKFPDSLEFIHEYFASSDYEVCITIQEGKDTSCFNGKICTKFKLNDNCQVTTATEFEMAQMIRIDPNPCREIVNLRTKLDIRKMSLIDLSGGEMNISFIKTQDGYQVDVANIASGVYILIVQRENMRSNYFKIIKE